jgi:hypothetical protein
MEIVWQVSQTERRISDNYVFVVHWSCSAQDGEFSGRVYSTCSWPDGQPVIPYQDLTQDEVLNWIWTSGVDKDATEAAVAAQIEAQKHPVTATGVPWSQ